MTDPPPPRASESSSTKGKTGPAGRGQRATPSIGPPRRGVLLAAWLARAARAVRRQVSCPPRPHPHMLQERHKSAPPCCMWGMPTAIDRVDCATSNARHRGHRQPDRQRLERRGALQAHNGITVADGRDKGLGSAGSVAIGWLLSPAYSLGGISGAGSAPPSAAGGRQGPVRVRRLSLMLTAWSRNYRDARHARSATSSFARQSSPL